jgi:hypothetical protein
MARKEFLVVAICSFRVLALATYHIWYHPGLDFMLLRLQNWHAGSFSDNREFKQFKKGL